MSNNSIIFGRKSKKKKRKYEDGDDDEMYATKKRKYDDDNMYEENLKYGDQASVEIRSPSKKKKKKNKVEENLKYGDEASVEIRSPSKKKKKENKIALDASVDSLEDYDTMTSAEIRSPSKKKKENKIAVDTSVESLENYDTRTSTEIRSSSKKKKKENKVALDASGESLEDYDPMTSVEIRSPSKKKKENKIDLDASIESLEDYDTMVISTCNMSVEELKRKKKEKDENNNGNSAINRALLRAAIKQLKHTHKSFSHEWKNLNYEEIAEKVGGGMTAEKCKKTLKELTKLAFKTKSLHQVLKEAVYYQSASGSRKMRYANAYAVFISTNKEEIKEVVRTTGKQIMSVAADMWNKLTDAERQAWSSKRKKTYGKPPFDVYFESIRAKDETANINEERSKWRTLTMKEKIKYILESAKIMMDFIEGRENGMLIDRKDVAGPSYEEVIYFLEGLGMPKYPTTLPHVYYLKESGVLKNEPATNILQEANRRFSRLDFNKKALWIAKFEKATRDYDKNIKKWKDAQDAATLTVYQLFEDFCEERKREEPACKWFARTKSQLKTIEMPIRKVNFDGEPIAPPVSIVYLYMREMKEKTGETLHFDPSKRVVGKLSTLEKETLRSKLEEMKLVYINQIKSFVDALPKDQRKLFLGLRRLNIMKVLVKDIFQKDYPDSDYPVYIKMQSKKPEKSIPISENDADKSNKSKTHVIKEVKKKVSSKKENSESRITRSITTQKVKKPISLKNDKVKTEDMEVSDVDIDKLLMSEASDTFEDVEPEAISGIEWGKNSFPDDDTEESLPVTPNVLSKSKKSFKAPSYSTAAKMESDSDNDDDINGESIQAYMNFLTFNKESITKEEEEPSDDE